MSVVKPLWAGAKGVDCNTKLTAMSAAALKADGIDFVMRYLPLSGNMLGQDLDAAEVGVILNAGLGLGAVQHTREADKFTPNAATGAADGRAALQAAQDAGLPGGMTLFYDMEGPAPGTTSFDCAAYDAAWCGSIGAYMPGGYFGYGLPLNGGQLWLFHVVRYWKSGSNVAEPANAGWCMTQKLPFNQRMGGVAVDLDAVTGDKLGRFPNCLFADDVA